MSDGLGSFGGMSDGSPASSGPPGTVSLTQVELDFGSAGYRSQSFTVIDSNVTGSSKIMMTQSAEAPTGKSQDENEMDMLICRAVSSSGQFTAYIDAMQGPVTGKFKFNYLLG